MRAKELIPLMSGPPDAMARWAQICLEGDRREDEWIVKLRSEGIKAAHPDDGWVDRERNRVHFAYPQFNDGVEVGDRIALGWPFDKHRIVKVIGKSEGIFLERWFFEPV